MPIHSRNDGEFDESSSIKASREMGSSCAKKALGPTTISRSYI